MARNPRSPNRGGVNPSARPRPAGQVRRSQLLNTFGPGALIDLPKHSVLVGGLDHWRGTGASLDEPRLLQKIRRFLPDVQELREPPLDPDSQNPTTGVTVWQFPEWFITQDFIKGRARRLVHRSAVRNGQVEDDDDKKKKQAVVPVRFVRACPKGHIGDIDWYSLVHHDDPKSPCRRALWMEEQGSSGDLASLWLRCDCGKRRSMAAASKRDFKALGRCDGSRLWLGRGNREECDEPNRLLIRSASHAYFAQLLSVISLPMEQDDPVKDVVAAVWDTLAEAETVEDVEFFRHKVAKVREAAGGYDSGQIFNVIRARRAASSDLSDRSVATIKDAELEVLTADQDPIGRDYPDSVFYARALPRPVWNQAGMQAIERVLLVHRLREVVAQVGFTRFEAVAPDTDGELDIGVERAALGLDTHWLPAVDNRGEGIFIGFRREAIQRWLHQPAVIQRHHQLEQGFKCWLAEHPKSERIFPGADYLLLHTLSHLLLTVIALDCGYPASALRERVYASDLGYGILLYTASPDAEGTLGGLVKTGQRIHHHLAAALDWGRLCSNDPVCAQHPPDDPHEQRFLHGAACHGCLLIAETSCEQFNDFLDRTLVIPTVDHADAAFFQDSA